MVMQLVFGVHTSVLMRNTSVNMSTFTIKEYSPLFALPVGKFVQIMNRLQTIVVTRRTKHSIGTLLKNLNLIKKGRPPQLVSHLSVGSVINIFGSPVLSFVIDGNVKVLEAYYVVCVIVCFIAVITLRDT